MKVSPFVDRLRREFAAHAQNDSEDASAAAPLELAIRLTLFDALAAAADEINRNLSPGSVELRLRGAEVNFVVTPPSPERSRETAAARIGVGTSGRHGKRARQRYTAWVR